MRARSVLLDADFIDAIVNNTSADHAECSRIYRELLDRYAAGTDRLFALSTVLATVSKPHRQTALAPIETLHVAGQHHSAARRVAAEVTPQTALALVMMAREKIAAVVAVGDQFEPFNVENLRHEPPVLAAH